MNFNSYGLRPSVICEQKKWRVRLHDAEGGFDMEIVAAALVDALRQADMAAGGWYAQRQIEESLLDEKKPLGTSKRS